MNTPETIPEPVADAPIAWVKGEAFTKMPQDLYIPPQALEVVLETFEGPLDLLLYLIRKHNLDILDIPVAEITAQYMVYVELMKDLQLELAAEYLVMAAMLAEIKSRMLLPRPPLETEEDGDPRADLIRRLQEYERFKKAAEDIDNLEQAGRDYFVTNNIYIEKIANKKLPEIDMWEMMAALRDVLKRASLYTHHHIQKEALSVRERMGQVLSMLTAESFTEFTQLFNVEEGRRGCVVTFLAVLELMKASLIELVQNDVYGPIYVKAKQ